jgi:hypothetical protein
MTATITASVPAVDLPPRLSGRLITIGQPPHGFLQLWPSSAPSRFSKAAANLCEVHS